MSHDLDQILADAERRCVGDWVRGLARIPGNPCQATTQPFGKAEAVICGASQLEVVNRIFSFDERSLDTLSGILEWYAGYGVTPIFDITPSLVAPYGTTPNTLAFLASHGLYQGGFHQQLHLRLPDLSATTSTRSSDVSIEIAGPDDVETVRALYVAQWGTPILSDPWVTEAPFFCFIATVDDAPAGIGVLHVDGPVASFVNAMTLPTYRGRGVQSALIQARLSRARSRDCELVVSQCRPGSVSQRNQLRAGFEVRTTKVWWMPQRTN